MQHSLSKKEGEEKKKKRYNSYIFSGGGDDDDGDDDDDDYEDDDDDDDNNDDGRNGDNEVDNLVKDIDSGSINSYIKFSSRLVYIRKSVLYCVALCACLAANNTIRGSELKSNSTLLNQKQKSVSFSSRGFARVHVRNTYILRLHSSVAHPLLSQTLCWERKKQVSKDSLSESSEQEADGLRAIINELSTRKHDGSGKDSSELNSSAQTIGEQSKKSSDVKSKNETSSELKQGQLKGFLSSNDSSDPFVAADQASRLRKDQGQKQEEESKGMQTHHMVQMIYVYVVSRSLVFDSPKCQRKSRRSIQFDLLCWIPCSV